MAEGDIPYEEERVALGGNGSESLLYVLLWKKSARRTAKTIFFVSCGGRLRLR